MATDYYVKTRELAEAAGVSIPVLCAHAGISRGAPGQWSGGKFAPTMRTWQKVTDAAARLKAKKAEFQRKAGIR